MILGENSFFPRRNALAFVIIFSALFLTSCARPVTRTSKTYFAPPPTVAMPAPQGFYHTIEKGQTLYHIAKMYNVNLDEIKRANNIQNPSTLEVGQKLFIPQQNAFVSGQPLTGAVPVSLEDARRIIGPYQNIYYWKTITVHHSGTHQGGARNFDRDHTRRKMGGLFYHFVIGNGTNTGNGEVEVGFRWKRQIRANRPYDIQICLVGNFDEQQVSDAQFNTLVNLIHALQEEYHISIDNIRQHRDIPGKHTDCPGKNFPFRRLISALR